MSVLKRSLESALANAFPGDVTGTTGWQAGMRWAGPGPDPVRNIGMTESLQLSSVYACIRLISEAMATLPLDTYTRGNGIRKPFRPRPAYLEFQPPQMSRIDYVSQVVVSLLTAGNAWVGTPRDAEGVPLALIPVNPAAVFVWLDEKGRKHVTVNGVEVDPLLDIMHIKGMSMPGALLGMSPLAYARATIDLGLAAQEFGRSWFDNGAMPSAVIEMEDEPDEAGKIKAARVAESWRDTHGNSRGGSGQVGVLLGKAAFKPLSISPEESQFLETRRFQVSDIARIYGVPPHLIADASGSTSWGSGLQEQNLAFGQFSLRPWLERFEDAHSRLLTTHGLKDQFVKLNLDALLRASLKDRYESYAVGIVNRFQTVNEVRALEDQQPVPWGDEPPEQLVAPVGPKKPTSPDAEVIAA